MHAVETRCSVVGGGPAGMMLGLLLARAGIDVIVLEKHGDFLRDFRGDTVHPSTLELMHELGCLDEFLARPHQEFREIGGQIGAERVVIADFSHLPVKCPFVALMPQWDFLDFLADRGRRYPTFHVRMNTEATELIVANDGQVAGLRARSRTGEDVDIHADLVVGADGRGSKVRELAGLRVEDLGAPVDVLWLRLSKRPDDSGQTFGYIMAGHIFVIFDRGDYWQCAYVIAKGGFEALQRDGIDAFRRTIAEIVPFLSTRVGELQSWESVKLLTVKVDRLREWARPGLLCIGDAAHAMSPIGGVGINLAVQDAVAAANLLVEPLKRGVPSIDELKTVQERRDFPTRATQRIQLFIQDRVMTSVLASSGPVSLPLPMRMLRDHPVLRRLPARAIGLGFRPEHVRTPDAFGYV
jgi:2-polyprenyl-6-methoxyphenol hydroxylase-like FAD-dependent oxidoreductase